jgi:hypothetical protein
MIDKLAGYKMTYEKILEILDKNGIKTIHGKKVTEEDDFLFYFDEMLNNHELLGENMPFGETIPTDYPRGSENGIVILSRVYKWDHKSTLSHVLRVREKEEDMAAKAAFIQRYGEYGVQSEDLTWVTVVDPWFRA